MANETQITMKMSNEEKELIIQASKLIGLMYSSFCRMATLEKARDILKKNN